MPTIYQPRPRGILGGTSNVSNAPTGNLGSFTYPSFESCFTMEDLIAYLQQTGQYQDGILPEWVQIQSSPKSGLMWYCGELTSKYKSTTFKINSGKYAGGSVKYTRGKLDRDPATGNATWVDVPPTWEAFDSLGKKIDIDELLGTLGINQLGTAGAFMESPTLGVKNWVWIVLVVGLLLIFLLRKRK